ncbi:unnamed protein product [Amoebophrya sp. A25]|nr:unnamed protein product [Amoebophrya sp. A25]|eukprot:GSA25T00014606001.1
MACVSSILSQRKIFSRVSEKSFLGRRDHTSSGTEVRCGAIVLSLSLLHNYRVALSIYNCSVNDECLHLSKRSGRGWVILNRKSTQCIKISYLLEAMKC